MVGLAIGLIIALACIIALLFICDREKRRRISAERKAEKVVAEGTAQWYLEEARKSRERTAKLESPISSSPEAVAALAGRLELLRAKAEHLDAMLDEKEANIKARENAEIREAENRVKELKLRDTSVEEIREAENQVRELEKAAQQRRKSASKQT